MISFESIIEDAVKMTDSIKPKTVMADTHSSDSIEMLKVLEMRQHNSLLAEQNKFLDEIAGALNGLNGISEQLGRTDEQG